MLCVRLPGWGSLGSESWPWRGLRVTLACCGSKASPALVPVSPSEKPLPGPRHQSNPGVAVRSGGAHRPDCGASARPATVAGSCGSSEPAGHSGLRALSGAPPPRAVMFVHTAPCTGTQWVLTQQEGVSRDLATSSWKCEFSGNFQKFLLLCQFPSKRVLCPGSCLRLQPWVWPFLLPHSKP